ncbi:MAG TPA: hypothetical protein VNO26_07380 [Candidatus Limnocylindria bacterium]|nr:hypothetical protein [Candidatus Limnocylindria bacterium]
MVIPAYNEEAVLAETLRSVARHLTTGGGAGPRSRRMRRSRESDAASAIRPRVADDPLPSRTLQLVARKLMIFRPLGPGAETRCDW